MALIKCSECHAQISSKAVACPKCGAPAAEVPSHAKPKSGGAWWKWSLVVLGLFVVVVVVVSNSPNNDRRITLRMAIDSCNEDLQKAKTVGEQRIISGACEKLESEYRSLRDSVTFPSVTNPQPEAPPVMGRWEREALEEAQRKAAQEAEATKKNK